MVTSKLSFFLQPKAAKKVKKEEPEDEEEEEEEEYEEEEIVISEQGSDDVSHSIIKFIPDYVHPLICVEFKTQPTV